MRLLVVSLLFVSLGAFAQTVPAGQTRQVRSSSDIDSVVGSPLVALVTTPATLAGWSIDSELNTTPGIPAGEFFFTINNAGQLTVLQNLDRFFPAGSPGATVTLTVTAYFSNSGTASASANVTIYIIEDTNTPIIPTGQSRNVVVTTEQGTSVGSPLIASNSPDSWSINSEDNYVDGVIPGVGQYERFFDIDEDGQITVLQSLERFFNGLAARGDQLTVTLNVSAFLSSGGSDTADVTIYIIEGTTPAILGSQTRFCTTAYDIGDTLQDPLQGLGNPTYWSITDGTILDNGGSGFNAKGAFAIDNEGQITTTLYLDQFFYNANPYTVNLTIVAGSIYGESNPVTVPVSVSVVTNNRCGYITSTQTRYVSSIAAAGTNIGQVIDTHGIDSIWIDAAWLDGDIVPNADVATYFTIVATGSTLGQIQTSRGLQTYFDPEAITRVRLRVRGHVVGEQCPAFSDEEVFVYVLPSDAGGGGGTTGPDFSVYIDDDSLLRCIRERLGLTGSDPLSASAILATSHLDCGCRNDDPIHDLDGIHLFTSMEELNLANNFISDIRPLALLTSLTDLNLAGNMISDITTSNPLAAMSEMVNIDLSHNSIRDTNAFSSMSQIRTLSLAYNTVCDVASLVSLGRTGGIGPGDSIYLDGNHLLSSSGQTQLAALQNTLAFISFTNNNGVCSSFAPVQLTTWPVSTVIEFTNLVSTNAGLACN